MPVSLVGPDGREYELDESQGSVDDAVAKGFRVLQAGEAPSTLESARGTATDLAETAKVGAMGGLEGLTLGLSKRLTEEAKSEQARIGQDTHETAGDVGKVAGFLLSPVNKVAAPLKGLTGAATFGARLAGSVLEGAGIGALAGAGEAVGDASLPGAPELNAETLLYHAGLGALLGGAGGGFGEALTEGASAILPKVGKLLASAKVPLDEFANDAAIGATRAQQSIINRMSEADIAAAAKALRERGHLELTPERMAQSLEKDLAATGAKKGAFLDAADKAGVAPDFGAALQRLDDFEKALPPLERQVVAGNVAKARTALEDIATGGNASWRELDRWKQGLQAQAKFSRGAVEDDLALGLRRQLAGVAREELDRQLVPALGQAGQDFLATKSTYGALKSASRLAESGAGRVGGIGLRDMLVGVAGANLHPFGIASAVGSKFVRELGPGLIAKAADSIAKSPTLMAIANGFTKRAASVNMGSFAPMFQQAAAKGPQAVLATHMLLAQVSPEYQQLSAGFRDADGPSLARASSVAQVGANLAEADSALDAQVARVFKGEKLPPSVSAGQDFGAKRLRKEGHEVRVEQIQQLAADPSQLVERIAANSGNLSNVTPGVAAALAATAQRAVDYLAKSSAQPLKPGPLAAKWEASQSERESFARKYAAIVDPGIVLEHAAAGTMTPDEWDAVKAVYPTLAQSISNKAFKRLAEGPTVPYRARLMVSMLAGVSADGSSSSAAIAQNQAAIHSAPAKQDSMQSGPLRVSNRMATPSQRREMEEP